MDLSDVFSGLSATSLVAALIGACTVMVLPSFAKWGAQKIGSFFDSDPVPEFDDYVRDNTCPYCFHDLTDDAWEDGQCQHCGGGLGLDD